MSYTTNIGEFRGLGNVMSQQTDIENHKASGVDTDLLCTKLSCVSQKDRTYDQYEPEPEQYLDYYNELNCDNEKYNKKFVAPGYPDSSLSDAEINDAIGKKTNLGCYSDETGIGSRSSTSAADTSIIPVKEYSIHAKVPPISETSETSEPSKRLDDLGKKLDGILKQLNDKLAETTGVMKDNPVEITDKKIKAIEKHAIRQGTTYAKFMELFDGNIDDAYKFVTMSRGGYKVKKRRSGKRRSRKRRSGKRRSSKRRSGKRRSGKRRSVKRSNQHKKK